MAQSIVIKRGLEANRTLTPLQGELIFTTDTKKVYIGDNSTVGGIALAMAGDVLPLTGGVLTGELTGTSLVLSGNLTVSGTTTSVNSTEVNIGDNIIVLNFGEDATPSLDAGIEIERGTSANQRLVWDETSDQWATSNDVGTIKFGLVTDEDFQSSGIMSTDGSGIYSVVTTDTTAGGTSGSASLITSGAVFSGLSGKQDLDADLTAIAALSGTSGILTTNGSGTWSVDTTTYGEIISVSGGNGLTATGTTAITLAVGAGTGITVNADSIQVSDNGISALQLNVVGNGTSGQVLSSDADGSFSWITPSNGITDLGFTASPTTGTITSSTGTNATVTLATGTNSGFLAPADFTKLGNISVTQSVDLDGMESDIASNNAKVSNVDSTIATGTLTDTSYPVTLDGGATYTFVEAVASTSAGMISGSDKAKLDGITSGATANVGTVTSVTAGAGMTQTGTSTVNPTLDIVAGDSSIIVSADSIVVGSIDGGTF